MSILSLAQEARDTTNSPRERLLATRLIEFITGPSVAIELRAAQIAIEVEEDVGIVHCMSCDEFTGWIKHEHCARKVEVFDKELAGYLAREIWLG